MGGSSSDFWWLTQSQLNRFNYLELGYSKPVDDSTRPIIREQKCHVTEIEAFRSKYQNTNVFRSLKLSDNLSTGQEIIGPFLVDIDNESDLDASRIVAQQVLEYLIEQLNLSPISDLRIFFTGHKGFNIEVRPDVLQIIGLTYEQIMHSSHILDDIISNLRKNNTVCNPTINSVDNKDTIIDKIYGDRFEYKLKHPFIRLHNSINQWLVNDNSFTSRKKTELTYKEVFDKSILEILLISES